jgi:hypothetical protein
MLSATSAKKLKRKWEIQCYNSKQVDSASILRAWKGTTFPVRTTASADTLVYETSTENLLMTHETGIINLCCIELLNLW